MTTFSINSAGMKHDQVENILIKQGWKMFACHVVLAMCTAIPSVVHAQNGWPVVVINVQEALARGAQHPLAERAGKTAAADSEKATASYRQVYWPTAGVTIMGERSDALSIIDSPVGSFEAGNYNRGQLQLAARMILFNPAANLRAEADALVANASALSVSHRRNDYAMAAAHRYFDVLRLDVQLLAAKNLLRSQQVRLDRVTALYASGRVLLTDLLKSRVDVQQSAQDITQQEGKLRVAQLELGQACGSDQAMQADELAYQFLPMALDDEPSELVVQEGLRSRANLIASQQRVLGLSKRADAMGKELRSANVELVVQHTERRGIALFPQRENSIALQLKIPLFSGVNDPQQRALLHERDAMELSAMDEERSARLEYTKIREGLATQLRLKSLLSQRIDSASQRLAQVNALYAIGRIQIDEVRQAEVEHENQKLSATMVEIEIARLRLALRHALGMTMYSVSGAPLDYSKRPVSNGNPVAVLSSIS